MIHDRKVWRLAVLGLLLAPSAVVAQAVNVQGDWNVTIVSKAEGTLHGFASFLQEGTSVMGWVGPSASDPIKITGVLKAGKFTIQTFPQPGRTVAFAVSEVIVDGERMTGTIDGDKGTIEFVRDHARDGHP